MMGWSTFCKNILQKKDISDDMARRDLRKVLTLTDLSFLAVGSMIGAGVYVFTGTVARNIAGPSIVLSYMIAAIASGFSAICYAEFAARIPVACSAYQFTYLIIGEFWAYIVGWVVYMEHVIGLSAISKAWSGYVDGLSNHTIERYLSEHAPLPGGMLSTYPDLLGGAVVLIVTIIIVLGVKISSRITIVFVVINLIILTLIFCGGMVLAKGKYWTAKGSFFPFGFSGTLHGASTLIFSYVGYEVLASAAEEAVNPKRDIPIALLVSLSITAAAYVGSSAALTLMVPIHEIVVTSPFPSAFSQRGWDWAQYIVSIGAVAAMSAASLSILFVPPRYAYVMARDELILPIFQRVNKNTEVPVIGTVVSGLISFVFAIFFALDILVEFISIGQLTATSFVSFCIIKLRYEPNEISKYQVLPGNDAADVSQAEPAEASSNVGSASYQTTTSLTKNSEQPSCSTSRPAPQLKNTSFQSNERSQSFPVPGVVKDSVLNHKFGYLFQWTLKYHEGTVPFGLLLLATASSVVAICLWIFADKYFKEWWFILIITLTILVTLVSLSLITAFNQDHCIHSFKVPFVPFLPFASIIINLILILHLTPMTLVRFLVWVALGIVTYFLFGYHHSKARKRQ